VLGKTNKHRNKQTNKQTNKHKEKVEKKQPNTKNTTQTPVYIFNENYDSLSCPPAGLINLLEKEKFKKQT
jgi:hypothetical protein